MGTLADTIRDTVREAVQDAKHDIQQSSVPSAELTTIRSELGMLMEKIDALEGRIRNIEIKIQKLESSKTELIETALGNEVETLRALRKNIGGSQW